MSALAIVLALVSVALICEPDASDTARDEFNIPVGLLSMLGALIIATGIATGGIPR